MTRNRDNFATLTSCYAFILFGNDAATSSMGTRSVESTTVNKGTQKATLQDLLYVPGLMNDLLSFSQAHKRLFEEVVDNGLNDPKRGTILHIHKSSGVVKLIGIQAKYGLYEAVISVNTAQIHVANVCRAGIWLKYLDYYSKKGDHGLDSACGRNQGDDIAW